MGYSLYLTLIVLIPLSALFLKTEAGGWQHFWNTITSPQVVASYKVSFGISFIAALLNGVFGVIAAWVLVRYRFPWPPYSRRHRRSSLRAAHRGRGIALTTLYAPNEWIGHLFAYNQPLGSLISPETPFGAWLATQGWAKDFLDARVCASLSASSAFSSLSPSLAFPSSCAPCSRSFRICHMDVEEGRRLPRRDAGSRPSRA